MTFQQYVLEAAGGASPYRCSALKLTFGNTIDAIKQERQKVEEERKAREEAEKQVAIEAERHKVYMARPMLECPMTLEDDDWDSYQRMGCGEVSIQDVRNGCHCGRSLVCSKCHQIWGGGEICVGCDQKFR